MFIIGPEDDSYDFHLAYMPLSSEYAAVYSDDPLFPPFARLGFSGVVFMNRLLLQLLTHELKSAGRTVLVPHTVPVNDGCIAYGQAAVASARHAQIATQKLALARHYAQPSHRRNAFARKPRARYHQLMDY